VRSRGIYLFPDPVLQDAPATYQPIREHSFGWIDGISVTQRSSGNLSILLRGESEDRWVYNHLNLFTLEHNPKDDVLPYVFPPILVSQVPALRGSLRCLRVVLGKCGTAVWIQPQDRAQAGLASSHDHHDHPQQAIRSVRGHESVVVAAFPGPLAPPGDEVDDSGVMRTRSRTLWSNSSNNWSSLDYNEEEGRIVLSSRFGKVMVLQL